MDANSPTRFDLGQPSPEIDGPLTGNDASSPWLDGGGASPDAKADVAEDVSVDAAKPTYDAAKPTYDSGGVDGSAGAGVDGAVDAGLVLDPATSAYAIDGWGEFGALDLGTGKFTKIGSGLYGTGYGPVRGLGEVKVDGHYQLFASSDAGDKGGTLWSINIATGQATLVGVTGISYNALGSTSAGLFALGFDLGSTTEKLYSISPTTGVATPIGVSGAGTGLGAADWYFGYDALSTSVDSPSLYAPYGGNGIQLFSVSTSLGTWAAVAAYADSNHGPGLAIYAGLNENGVLYAVYDHIDTINTTSGVETLGIAVTGSNGNIYGLAPVPSGP